MFRTSTNSINALMERATTLYESSNSECGRAMTAFRQAKEQQRLSVETVGIKEVAYLAVIAIVYDQQNLACRDTKEAHANLILKLLILKAVNEIHNVASEKKFEADEKARFTDMIHKILEAKLQLFKERFPEDGLNIFKESNFTGLKEFIGQFKMDGSILEKTAKEESSHLLKSSQPSSGKTF